jgi:hypothetical protein
MNNRQILASLEKIANELDNTGLYVEATSVTNIMKRLVVADEFNIETPTDERENKRQQIINKSLDTKVLRSNVPKTFLYMIQGNSPFLTIREVADALINMLQEQANESISEIKRGKQSADQPFENNVLRMANYFKETLTNLLETYNIPQAPVFYYINQKANEIVTRTKPQIEEYNEYHDEDLFLDNEK